MKKTSWWKWEMDVPRTILAEYIYMVFTTEGFLEVAIESWPEWI